MNIYTLVLDPINGPLTIETYVDAEVAKAALIVLCKQHPSYHVAEVPGLYFSVNLAESGGKGYIKETALIGWKESDDLLKWVYCRTIGSDSIIGLDCCDGYKDWRKELIGADCSNCGEPGDHWSPEEDRSPGFYMCVGGDHEGN